MYYNKITKRLALLVCGVVMFGSAVNATFAMVVTKTGSLINTFTPFDSIIGDILISKKVEHPFGQGYDIPDDIVFDFKVELGSLYAKTTIKTSDGDMVADENGALIISVRPGSSFAFTDIDAGTEVTVTEIQQTDNGFFVKGDTAVRQGVVAEDGSLQFEYINVYTPGSVSAGNVSVRGEKNLQGRNWQEGDEFSFVLEQKQSEGDWKTLGTKTVIYRADDTDFQQFDFSDVMHALTFDSVGVYDFRMTEVKGNLENLDYDKSVNTFSIKVSDIDMDGKLEIHTVSAAQNAKVSRADGKFNVTVMFNNTFTSDISEPEDITVNIPVNKTVNNIGKSKLTPQGFEFVLEHSVSGEKQFATSDKNGKTSFSLSFTTADIGKTYTYKLYETDQGKAGITYDDTVYDLSVTVTKSENDKLIASVVMSGQKTDTPIAKFVNTYQALPVDSPHTADDSNMVFWLTIMLVSGFMCVVFWIADKKCFIKGKHDKH